MKQTKHFKRLWSLMLLLIAMLMPQGAWAISGNGTASSPYLIANEADLILFQQYVETGNSGIYGKLTADITLTSAWTRIGRADRRFTGYFDGQGHTISGMNLSFTAYEHGFFGFVNNATIKNFTLTGTMTSSANGNHSHGTVVGSAAGTTVIENVTSSVNLTLNHTGFTCIGGIVGHMADNTRVTGCTYTGTINLTKDSEQVGGIVGYAQNDLYITDNVFSGTITSTGTCKYLAGIAGKTDGTIEVSGCTNIGTINGGPSYDCVAGIVGYVQYQSRALITNCYFGGSLSSTSSGTSLGMGGILGAVNDDAGTNFRGLTYCFSDGTLTATNSSSTQIGGIAGVIKSKAVSKVMNNTYLSGKASRLAAISNNSSTFDSSNKAITISVTDGTGGTVQKSYVYPTSTTATQLQVVATPNSGYHYVEWSDNGAQTHNVSLANNVSLTATFGAHTYGDWITDVAATCTSAGTHHRVCTHTGCGAREDGTIAALGHGTTGFTESYSWTGNAYNNPSQDTKACTFTLTCKKCSTKVVNGASLTCTLWSHVNATCTATGSTTYRATGSYTAANGDYNYISTNTHVYTVVPLGHGSTGYTESYVWTGNAYNDASKDTKACIFTLTCKNCSTKVVNGASLTCIKTAHVDATCRATGSTTYQATGSYTAANSAYNYSATKHNAYTVAALGHSYGAGSWSWADDGHSATCTRTCDRTNCYTNIPGHTSSKSVTLGNGIASAPLVAPNCGELGTTRYTATATVENVEYRDTKDIKDIPATGLHTFAASDLTHDVCTVCNHGFLRYEAYWQQTPHNAANLQDKYGNTLTIVSHTFDEDNNQGVMEFNAPLVTIGVNAFAGCQIKGITIPNTVTSIGDVAFTGTLLTSINIPNSVKTIGTAAFSNCWDLSNVTLGKSIEFIDDNAFSDINSNCNITLKSLPQISDRDYLNTFCYVFQESAGEEWAGDLELRPIPANIELDDNSYVAPESSLGNSSIANHVTYTRTGIKNQWGTIVVPFMVNGSDDDYDLYTLSSVSEFELTLAKVNGTLAAGTPALIRLHDDLDGDYSLTLTASNTTVSGQLNDGSEANGLQLVGTYETQELENSDYFISNNKCWSVGDMTAHGVHGVKTAPFRAYLRRTWAGVKARRNAPASPTELKRLDADGNGVIETADIDLMVASMLNGENDYSIGDVVRAIDNAGTSVAVATEMLEKGVSGDPDEPELDEYRWITIE